MNLHIKQKISIVSRKIFITSLGLIKKLIVNDII